jgi:hypothetical protein
VRRLLQNADDDSDTLKALQSPRRGSSQAATTNRKHEIPMWRPKSGDCDARHYCRHGLRATRLVDLLPSKWVDNKGMHGRPRKA